MLRATLTYLKRKEPLVAPASLAKLDPDDTDFLTRHVNKLRAAASEESAVLSRFQQSSAIPALFGDLLKARPANFIGISADLAKRLQASMDSSTRANPGVLAVITSGAGRTPELVSILKLDAIDEAARFLLKEGQVKLSVLRDLLPAPGKLQKGISWPDSRATSSDAIAIDRNQVAAGYFFKAYELLVSSTPKEAERALVEALMRDVPPSKFPEAMSDAAALSGPAQAVAAHLKKKYPTLQVDLVTLGPRGTPAGNIRPGKVTSHQTRYRGDGITVTIPHNRLDRVIGPREVAGGWELTIRFSTLPKREPS
jgi:hypothetical protein